MVIFSVRKKKKNKNLHQPGSPVSVLQGNVAPGHTVVLSLRHGMLRKNELVFSVSCRPVRKAGEAPSPDGSSTGDHTCLGPPPRRSDVGMSLCSSVSVPLK